MFVCNLTVDRPEHHQETHPVIVVFGLRAVDSTIADKNYGLKNFLSSVYPSSSSHRIIVVNAGT